MECTFENCQNFERLGKQFSDRISELEQENEQLKKKIESYVCSQNCYAYKQANNYRQILQEIKTIAERQMRCCTCKLDDYKSGCKECESKYAREIAVEILQKITKAEEE